MGERGARAAGEGLVLRSELHTALLVDLGFPGPEETVDVDALMVKNVGDPAEWDDGDAILFSIHDPLFGAWDGDEIIYYPFGGPAQFLQHGAHAWNDGFDTLDGSDVDGIEARPEGGVPPMHGPPLVPAMPGWGLGVLALGFAAGASFLGRRAGRRS